ncbi:glycosyltransferase family A protein [Catenovulum sediminis]|uniref:Glycosyltransferase family A protein n=1 Tax=Catenovulum sediminis TaxID=1740262 RepID=A0ABV1REA9_9ALTE
MNNQQNHFTTKKILTTRNIHLLKQCGTNFRNAQILVAINHRNQPEDLARALESVEVQTVFAKHKVQVVILDDHSSKNNVARLLKFADKPYITLLRAQCGSASQARNTILDWADEQMHVRWIARLDADDEFATVDSLEKSVQIGEQLGKSAILAGNQLSRNGSLDSSINFPKQIWLDNPEQFVSFVERFCTGQTQHELPSCNLVLANRSGIRYPNLQSAEDHWLVAMLLLLQPKEVALAPDNVYCNYSLNGVTTEQNKAHRIWTDTRQKLAFVVRKLFQIKKQGLVLLGYGMEGVVYENENEIIKEYHPWSIVDEDVARLTLLLKDKAIPIPSGTFEKVGKMWQFKSPRVLYKPVSKNIPYQKIKVFLIACYKGNIAPANIKRDNLMFHPCGDLHYIDIGKDLKPLSAGYFIDLSARLYAIGILGFSDYELARRSSSVPQDEILNNLDGFNAFYGDLITDLHPLNQLQSHIPEVKPIQSNTTLLIKACAQDADGLFEQISHIVTQLEYPKYFAEKILLIDLFEGPFLRQYAEPNLPAVIEQAKQLQKLGIIDKLISAPNSKDVIKETYNRWFNVSDVTETHTSRNAPLYNQIWAFDQINTQYVLQCDCDVLVGRKNWQHDFISDMLTELQKPDVHSVGFNIPKESEYFRPYFGKPGEFAPEVRFGMLDLHKFNQALPIQNAVINNQFTLTWHRAMQQHEKQSERLRSVRGGNPMTFYVHPNNIDKPFLRSGVVRDLIAQGKVPTKQQEAFDLVLDAIWKYQGRREEVVFLLKGRNTPYEKLTRCIESLCQQDDQDFGVIVIDDGSGLAHSGNYTRMLARLRDKTTLIRHVKHQGRMPNFLLAVNDICKHPNPMIAILDQDDFLMSTLVVSMLKQAKIKGHDLVNLPMFRPNKPLKLYQPDYNNSRKKHGANVWAHLRAFTKQCFMKIPLEHFKQANGQWFDCVTDYVTMLPLSELAINPIFLDFGYAYWHERDEYSFEYKTRQQTLLAELFNRPSLAQTNGILQREQALCE